MRLVLVEFAVILTLTLTLATRTLTQRRSNDSQLRISSQLRAPVQSWTLAPLACGALHAYYQEHQGLLLRTSGCYFVQGCYLIAQGCYVVQGCYLIAQGCYLVAFQRVSKLAQHIST